MERIISYNELPNGNGRSIYIKMNDTDPNLYVNLLNKGYKLIHNNIYADSSTIYVTCRRELTIDDYEKTIEDSFKDKNIFKPTTYKFSLESLKNKKYQLPFVFKNESINGGKEKFLIETENDYNNLIKACEDLINIDSLYNSKNYNKYLNDNFVIQEYIETPSKYNTTVRLLTSSSGDLLYGSLKYNKPEEYKDDTTLLGYFLNDIYPLSTKSIVSNTFSGGENILLGKDKYLEEEKELLNSHNIDSDSFNNLIEISKDIHKEYKNILGVICGFDYIYDKEKEKWFLLEYHSKPMVGDYSTRQNINYTVESDKITAEGRVRATALNLVLKK